MAHTFILLIEDNPDDEEFTLRALRRRRLTNEIIVVRDGQEALDFLFGIGLHAGRDIRELPQLILLDINLPKVNGIDVLRRIRAEPATSRLPVVILTTSAEERDLTAAYTNHVNSYVLKPLDFEQFATAVDQLGLYWLVLNQSPPELR